MKHLSGQCDGLAWFCFELFVAILLGLLGFALLCAADIQSLEATWPTTTMLRASRPR